MLCTHKVPHPVHVRYAYCEIISTLACMWSSVMCMRMVSLLADPDLMPQNKACHASWNVIATSGAEQQEAAICVSYCVKSLQALPEGAPDMFVTLNSPQPPREGTIFNEMSLSHPIFSMASWKAQSVCNWEGNMSASFKWSFVGAALSASI
jgi:predicted NAD/FAD-binding protein